MLNFKIQIYLARNTYMCNASDVGHLNRGMLHGGYLLNRGWAWRASVVTVSRTWLSVRLSSERGRTKQEQGRRDDKPPDHHHHHQPEPIGLRIALWSRHVLYAFVITTVRLRVPQQIEKSLHRHLVIPDAFTWIKPSVRHFASEC